jgi:hypothetical protein
VPSDPLLDHGDHDERDGGSGHADKGAKEDSHPEASVQAKDVVRHPKVRRPARRTRPAPVLPNPAQETHPAIVSTAATRHGTRIRPGGVSGEQRGALLC